MGRPGVLRFFVLTFVLVLAGVNGARAQVDVDLKLVLAVDISMSMDPDEQKLQREGYVAAFRDANIIRAIRSGQRGRIAVTYFEWAGPQAQTVLMPWQIIDSEASSFAFADALLNQPYSRRARTSISSALMFARNLFAETSFRAGRNVIDVSGDGVNNSGPLLAVTRTLIMNEGFVINGLPILVRPTMHWSMWDAPDLDLYYAKCVVGGPGSFSIPIETLEGFAAATRQKLLLEISAIPTVGLIRVQDSGGGTPGGVDTPKRDPQAGRDIANYDCGMVERQIERRQWDN